LNSGEDIIDGRRFSEPRDLVSSGVASAQDPAPQGKTAFARMTLPKLRVVTNLHDWQAARSVICHLSLRP